MRAEEALLRLALILSDFTPLDWHLTPEERLLNTIFEELPPPEPPNLDAHVWDWRRWYQSREAKIERGEIIPPEWQS